MWIYIGFLFSLAAGAVSGQQGCDVNQVQTCMMRITLVLEATLTDPSMTSAYCSNSSIVGAVHSDLKKSCLPADMTSCSQVEATSINQTLSDKYVAVSNLYDKYCGSSHSEPSDQQPCDITTVTNCLTSISLIVRSTLSDPDMGSVYCSFSLKDLLSILGLDLNSCVPDDLSSCDSSYAASANQTVSETHASLQNIYDQYCSSNQGTTTGPQICDITTVTNCLIPISMTVENTLSHPAMQSLYCTYSLPQFLSMAGLDLNSCVPHDLSSCDPSYEARVNRSLNETHVNIQFTYDRQCGPNQGGTAVCDRVAVSGCFMNLSQAIVNATEKMTLGADYTPLCGKLETALAESNNCTSNYLSGCNDDIKRMYNEIVQNTTRSVEPLKSLLCGSKGGTAVCDQVAVSGCFMNLSHAIVNVTEKITLVADYTPLCGKLETALAKSNNCTSNYLSGCNDDIKRMYNEIVQNTTHSIGPLKSLLCGTKGDASTGQGGGVLGTCDIPRHNRCFMEAIASPDSGQGNTDMMTLLASLQTSTTNASQVCSILRSLDMARLKQCFVDLVLDCSQMLTGSMPQNPDPLVQSPPSVVINSVMSRAMMQPGTVRPTLDLVLDHACDSDCQNAEQSLQSVDTCMADLDNVLANIRADPQPSSWGCTQLSSKLNCALTAVGSCAMSRQLLSVFAFNYGRTGGFVPEMRICQVVLNDTDIVIMQGADSVITVTPVTPDIPVLPEFESCDLKKHLTCIARSWGQEVSDDTNPMTLLSTMTSMTSTQDICRLIQQMNWPEARRCYVDYLDECQDDILRMIEPLFEDSQLPGTSPMEMWGISMARDMYLGDTMLKVMDVMVENVCNPVCANFSEKLMAASSPEGGCVTYGDTDSSADGCTEFSGFWSCVHQRTGACLMLDLMIGQFPETSTTRTIFSNCNITIAGGETEPAPTCNYQVHSNCMAQTLAPSGFNLGHGVASDSPAYMAQVLSGLQELLLSDGFCGMVGMIDVNQLERCYSDFMLDCSGAGVLDYMTTRSGLLSSSVQPMTTKPALGTTMIQVLLQPDSAQSSLQLLLDNACKTECADIQQKIAQVDMCNANLEETVLALREESMPDPNSSGCSDLYRIWNCTRGQIATCPLLSKLIATYIKVYDQNDLALEMALCNIPIEEGTFQIGDANMGADQMCDDTQVSQCFTDLAIPAEQSSQLHLAIFSMLDGHKKANQTQICSVLDSVGRDNLKSCLLPYMDSCRAWATVMDQGDSELPSASFRDTALTEDFLDTFLASVCDAECAAVEPRIEGMLACGLDMAATVPAIRNRAMDANVMHACVELDYQWACMKKQAGDCPITQKLLDDLTSNTADMGISDVIKNCHPSGNVNCQTSEVIDCMNSVGGLTDKVMGMESSAAMAFGQDACSGIDTLVSCFDDEMTGCDHSNKVDYFASQQKYIEERLGDMVTGCSNQWPTSQAQETSDGENGAAVIQCTVWLMISSLVAALTRTP